MTDDRKGWLEELALDLGDEAARRLCAAAGGQRRHIPLGGGWISRELGEETGSWLAARFGGEHLQIPLLETNQQALRRRQMAVVAAAEGVSVNELAQRLGVHRSTVQRLRQSLRAQSAARAGLKLEISQ